MLWPSLITAISEREFIILLSLSLSLSYSYYISKKLLLEKNKYLHLGKTKL